jgi:putative transcriptional regulator
MVALGVAVLALAAPGAFEANGQAGPGLAGQLLVATEQMPDPRFFRTVIYMVRHDATGALGLVVNRPLGDVRLKDLLERSGRDSRDVTGSVRVHYGGPVEPARAFVLHTADYTGLESRVIGDGIAVTGHPEVLDAMARGQGPRRSLFVLGYAGWAPGQLEGEIQRGGWISVLPNEALVFDEDHERKWERAMARRRIDL